MKKMKLEDIGFYTLSDNRAKNVSGASPMQRCEIRKDWDTGLKTA
jgi:hypothetical protein